MMRDRRRPAHGAETVLGKELLPGLDRGGPELRIAVPDNCEPGLAHVLAVGFLFQGAEEHLGATGVAIYRLPTGPMIMRTKESSLRKAQVVGLWVKSRFRSPVLPPLGALVRRFERSVARLVLAIVPDH